MENKTNEFILTLNKLQIQILSGVMVIIILIGSISTITLISELRSDINEFLAGMESGQEEAFKQIRNTVSDTIELAQQIITLQNGIEISTTNGHYIDEEELIYIDSEDRWVD